jgi:kynureninase
VSSHADIAHTWRPQFPILAAKTYLCSHSLGAVPARTEASLNRYYTEWATLGIEAWDGPWWQSVNDFGANIETVIGAAAGTVVPMQNVTRAFAAIASCFDFSGPRNRVVMTALEFTTSYPFWRGLESLGAEVVVVPSDDGMTVPVERICAAIDERTLLVPTSHVYFRSGALQDLGAIVERANAVGAFVVGDGYQTVGTVPVDVTQLGVHAYVGGSHKWLCGGPGAGFLYVREDLITTLNPRLTGWFGLRSPFSYEPGIEPPPLSDGIHRFLGGTPNVPGLYAAMEGIKIVAEVGVDAIRARSKALTAAIYTMATDRGLTIRTPADPEKRSGMICVDFDRSEAITRELLARDIIVDWRPDCGIRLSPHFYNLEEELDVFFGALDELRS